MYISVKHFILSSIIECVTNCSEYTCHLNSGRVTSVGTFCFENRFCTSKNGGIGGDEEV